VLSLSRQSKRRHRNTNYTAVPNNTNPLNPELNPTWYLLALLGAHHIFHVSRIRIKLDDDALKQVPKFKYQDRIFTEDGKNKKDIIQRIKEAKVIFIFMDAPCILFQCIKRPTNAHIVYYKFTH
jgi:hypothetical protein